MLMISVPAGKQHVDFFKHDTLARAIILRDFYPDKLFFMFDVMFKTFVHLTLASGSTVGVEIMPVLTSGSVARFRDQV
jgi:hypothetical protein